MTKFQIQRRERDSNPRYTFGVYTLSRRASSTTRASLLSKNSINTKKTLPFSFHNIEGVALHKNKKAAQKLLFSGETGKQKRFYTFCNKLYSNKLIRYKNAFLLIFVADMSLDKTSITSENQRILVIQLRLFNNSIYILPSNQPNNAIKKYFSNIHLLRNLLCSGCSGTDYQHFLYHHGYI